MDLYSLAAVALFAFGPCLFLYHAAGVLVVVLVLVAVFAAYVGMNWLSILLFVGIVGFLLLGNRGGVDDQSILSLFAVFWRYRNTDFDKFLRSNEQAVLEGARTGDYCPGVCNYYSVMAELITLTSGPFWHFVPMTKGLSRKECHDQFHHTTTDFLEAKKNNKILELGCGYGEIGRQVAKISGASVTGLTMADEEIEGGNLRIKKAGLQDRCRLVQGNYHDMPFEDSSFDKVFGIYTLKYSADLKKAVAEAARVLKPGGRFLSYEIIVTDKYDASVKEQKEMVHNISYSTCMPPLECAQAYRDAAKEAGLVLKQEIDLCEPVNEDPWYSNFEKTGVYYLISSSLVTNLVRFAEAIRILPRFFTKFYETHLVHPAKDFVEAGRMGIINGAVMMVWEKP